MKQRTRQDKLKTRQRRLALLAIPPAPNLGSTSTAALGRTKPAAQLDPESVFGYPVSLMYRDLVRSGVATVIIGGLLLLCIWWLR